MSLRVRIGYNSAMKLPRWLLIGLWTSSVLAVLAAAGWWWVTWPERTAQEFAKRIAEKRAEEASQMVRNDCKGIDADFIDFAFRDWEYIDLEYQPRTPLSLILGRQEFQLAGERTVRPMLCGVAAASMSPEEIANLKFKVKPGFRFTVQRGSVTQPFGILYDVREETMLRLGPEDHEEPFDPNWASHRI